MHASKLFPLSGIAFVALSLLTVIVAGGTPGTDTSAADVTSFYDETRRASSS